jgi:hypothetical protein
VTATVFPAAPARALPFREHTVPKPSRDLPAIIDGTTRLIDIVAALPPCREPCRELDLAVIEFRSVLHPGGVHRWREGEADITESDLDGDVQLVLLDLHRFVVGGGFGCEATRRRQATIARLKRLRADLQGLLPEANRQRVAAPPPEPVPLAVDSDDRGILRELNRSPSLLRTRDHIAGRTVLSRKNTGLRLNRLEGGGLVCRPRGEKGGWQITPSGSKLIEDLDRLDPPPILAR